MVGAAKAAEVLGREGRRAVLGHVFVLPPDLAEAFGAVRCRALPEAPYLRGEASGVEGWSAFSPRRPGDP
jgi:hypothetical protein